MSLKFLSFKVAGVKIDGNGLSWLQATSSGKEVVFIPLNNKGMVCYAKVFLVEKNTRDLDIGKELVDLGFAKVDPLAQEIEVNSDILRYCKQLKSSEFRAKTLRKGQWSALPENWVQWKIRTSFNKLMFNLKPKSAIVH
jgi:endonuclease YncB( thermonuclease family)